MKRTMLLVFVACMLPGCTGENTLSIINSAEFPVTFYFRSKGYKVPGGSTTRLGDEVPDGSYDYNSIYTVPRNADAVKEGDGLGGTLTFYNRNTDITVEYVSALDYDTTVEESSTEGGKPDTSVSATYEIGAVVSSSHFSGM